MSKIQSWLAGHIDSVQYPPERQQPPGRRMSFDEFLLRWTAGVTGLTVLVVAIPVGLFLLWAIGAVIYYGVTAPPIH